jgi:exosome complex component RRP43
MPKQRFLVEREDVRKGNSRNIKIWYRIRVCTSRNLRNPFFYLNIYALVHMYWYFLLPHRPLAIYAPKFGHSAAMATQSSSAAAADAAAGAAAAAVAAAAAADASKKQPPGPPALYFSRATFAKLAPRPFLLAHLQQSLQEQSQPQPLQPQQHQQQPPLRPNGRRAHECRPATVHTGSLSHADGSAVVRCGDTAVVCGVKAEVLLASDVPAAAAAAPSVPSSAAGPAPSLASSAAVPASVLSPPVASAAQQQHPQQQQSQRRNSGGMRHAPAATTTTTAATTTESAAQRRAATYDIRTKALLVPNVELATGCAPAHLPSSGGGGGAPSPLAQSLAVRILALLHAAAVVRDEDLRIRHHHPGGGGGEAEGEVVKGQAAGEDAEEGGDAEGEDAGGGEGGDEGEGEVMAYWTLYIDVLFISLDGNAFDAAWLAVLAALADVRLPPAVWDIDRQAVVVPPPPPPPPSPHPPSSHHSRSQPPRHSHPQSIASSFSSSSSLPQRAATRPWRRKLRLRALPVPCTFAVFSTLQPGRRAVPISGTTATAKNNDSTAAEARVQQQTGSNTADSASGNGGSSASGNGIGGDANYWILADPDAFEEEHCAEMATVTVDCESFPSSAGRSSTATGTETSPVLLKLEKNGGGVLARQHLRELVGVAQQRWAHWREQLQLQLQQQQQP